MGAWMAGEWRASQGVRGGAARMGSYGQAVTCGLAPARRRQTPRLRSGRASNRCHNGAMCGRFSVSVDPALLAERFAVELPGDARPRYNVARTQPILVVRRSRERGVVGDELRWGLVPHWARDRAGG